MRAGALSQLGILYKDFKVYFTSVTDTLKAHIESSASELGRPVKYLPSASTCKEEVARKILLSDLVDEGLICVLKTMETCNTAKVYGRNAHSSKLFILRWLDTHSMISHVPMFLPFWGANRTRGFREKQSPIINNVPLAAG